MAEVFRAIMPGVEGFQRTFVVKRILSERSSAPDFVEMFVQEARIGALLQHPNIVQVFDFGNVEGSYFLAMEYLRGRDLGAVMRRVRAKKKTLPASVAAFITREAALGLGHAHALTTPDGQPRNIIHRDVSPSNIMCLRTGGVKVLDFGIAKAFGSSSSENTEQGIFKGRLSYMAPERLKQEELDGRVDLFALGAVLWEALASRRLFHGKNELETLQNLMQMPVPPPSTLRPDLPASLDRVVMRALERKPEDRYRTGQDMADDLDEVMHETRYQSRMLPELLHELFGAEAMSTQIAVSDIAPELLSELTDLSLSARPEPTPRTPVPPLELEDVDPATGAPPNAFSPAPRKRRLALTLVAGIGGVVVVAAAAMAGVHFSGGPVLWGNDVPALPEERSVPAPPARLSLPGPPLPDPVRAAEATPPPPPVAGTATAVLPRPPVSEPGSAPAPAPAAAPAPASDPTSVKPSARARRSAARAAEGADERDRVARGLSIDPFAEAAAREGR